MDDAMTLFSAVMEEMKHMSEYDMCSLMPYDKNQLVGWYRGRPKKKPMFIKHKEFASTMYLFTALFDFEKTAFTFAAFFHSVTTRFVTTAFPDMCIFYLFMFGGVVHTRVSSSLLFLLPIF